MPGCELFLQQPLLQLRKPIERIKGGHGEEIHLANFLKHRMRRRERGIKVKRLLVLLHWPSG